MITYMADFETTADSDEETRVWLWSIANVDTLITEQGTDIDSFFKRISKKSCTCYFHNLKFDGEFIIYYLFHQGYKHTFNKKLEKGEFKTLISDMGLFYTMTVKTYKGTQIRFIDSLKKIPLAVADMPKAFGIPLEKLDIDYNAARDNGHEPTQAELEYVRNDVLIPSYALRYMQIHGMQKMTTASNALNDYKNILTQKEFDKMYPQLDLLVDVDCRKAYKGGWTYCNPKWQAQDVGEGLVYDVNSMYPWAMKYCSLPYGIPIHYQGRYEYDKVFQLYIQSLSCRFKLKPGKYPSIQIKGSIMFNSRDYIEECMDEPALLTLTSVDLELLYENYYVYDEEWHGGYKFRSINGAFDEYIDKWYDSKVNAKIEGNKALEYIAKLMLNSLYGKFGSNPRRRSKYPYLDPEKDIVRYAYGEEEIGTGGYVPVAAFITSYCRDKIIRAANDCGDRFMYADTDSIHILGTDPPLIDIDDKRLGAFKREGHFTRAHYLRPKCYIEEMDEELVKKCAGLPKSAREWFGFDTIKPQESFDGKLRPKHVPGGIRLVETKFTIK